ncbi:unnamed protein product [Parajaminaea phylloscopi]
MSVASKIPQVNTVVRQGDDPLSPVIGSGHANESQKQRSAITKLAPSPLLEQPNRHLDSSFASESSYSSRSPFADDHDSSHEVRGDEDIGLATHETFRSGWLTHGSTERLTGDAQDDEYSDRRSAGRDASGSYASHHTSGSNAAAYGGKDGTPRRKFTQVPPDDDDDESQEAKQVEQNLERWAAAEKQRRKAVRSSRSVSVIGTSDASGSSLARRLSTFTRKANTGAVVEPRTSTTRDLLKRVSIPNSISSADSGTSEAVKRERPLSLHTESFKAGQASVNRHSYAGRGLDWISSAQRADEESEAASASSNSSRKGKARALDDGSGGPFSDANGSASQGARQSPVKPTPTRPIVTPGNAPSIRRTPAGMPSIIATDADTNYDGFGATKTRGGHASRNPFLSTSEASAAEAGHQALDAIRETREGDGEQDSPTSTSVSTSTYQKPAFHRKGTSDTITTFASTTTTRQPGSSSRMSMSKFREIGLEEDSSDGDAVGGASLRSEGRGINDVGEHGYPRHHGSLRSQMLGDADNGSDARERAAAAAEEERQRIRDGNGRQPWWTEWICGCGHAVDEDNEQTGKTGPE